jgi:lauroyl/myristoyl acyltransferase
LSQSKFERAFLHPRYWFTWFGLGVLWLLVQLPYPVLRLLGSKLGSASRYFLKRRESIARKNIELCFRSTMPKSAKNSFLKTSNQSGWRCLKPDGLVLAR